MTQDDSNDYTLTDEQVNDLREKTVWVGGEPGWRCICGCANVGSQTWCLQCWGPRDGDPNE